MIKTEFKAQQLMLALVFFAALLCFVRWPVFDLFSTHVLGGVDGDSNLYFWLVTTFPHNLSERGWFETNSFYPYQNTLAFSDNFLFPSAVFYLLNTIVRVSEIPSWNVLILLAQLLNGVSVFHLAKRLGANFYSGLLLGSIFISSTYFSQNLGHPQLQFFFFIPVGFAVFISLLSKPSWQKSFFLSLTVTLSFLTTVYFAVALILICFLHLFFQILMKEPVLKRQLPYLMLSGALTALFIFPFLLPYLKVKDSFGSRGLHEFYYFGFSALSIFAAPPISKLYSVLSSLSHDEAYFGWGLVSLLILVLASRKIWSISPLILIFTLLALIFADQNVGESLGLDRSFRLSIAISASWLCFFWLCIRVSKPPVGSNKLTISLCSVALVLLLVILGPLGFSAIKTNGLGVFRLFYEIFPGVDSLRAISRLAVVVMLLLFMSAIPSLNAIGKKLLLLIPIIITESAVSSFPLAPLPAAPAIFENLASLTDKQSAVLISPISGELDKNNQVKSWSELAAINSSYLVALRHSRPWLMNGHSGQRPKTIFNLPRIMRRFPSQAALDSLLKFERLRYVVILGSRTEGFSAETFLRSISALSSEVKILVRHDNDFIIELLRTSQAT